MDMLGRTSAGSCGPRGLHTDGAGTTAATSTGPQGRGTGRGLDPDSLSCELGRWPPSFSVTPAPTLTWQTRPSRTVKTASRGPRGRGLIRGERVDGRWDTRRHGRPHGRGKLWLEPTPSPETRAHVGLRGPPPRGRHIPPGEARGLAHRTKSHSERGTPVSPPCPARGPHSGVARAPGPPRPEPAPGPAERPHTSHTAAQRQKPPAFTAGETKSKNSKNENTKLQKTERKRRPTGPVTDGDDSGDSHCGERQAPRPPKTRARALRADGRRGVDRPSPTRTAPGSPGSRVKHHRDFAGSKTSWL